MFNVFIYISPRSVIINLAKSLSSKLQKLMAANNLKIDNVLSEQKNNSAGYKSLLKVKKLIFPSLSALQQFEMRLLIMESEKRGFMDKLSKIGREILEIQNKQDLDQNVISTCENYFS